MPESEVASERNSSKLLDLERRILITGYGACMHVIVSCVFDFVCLCVCMMKMGRRGFKEEGTK